MTAEQMAALIDPWAEKTKNFDYRGLERWKTALDGAQSILTAQAQERDAEELDAEAAAAFVNALLNPPAPNEALRRAAERYKKAIARQKAGGLYPMSILVEVADIEAICATADPEVTAQAQERGEDAEEAAERIHDLMVEREWAVSAADLIAVRTLARGDQDV